MHWTRAARTDKGVSAVGQLVALKCIVDPPGLVDRINAALPAAFRCFGFTRVTNGFNAKNLCDKRRLVRLVVTRQPNTPPRVSLPSPKRAH